jgi:hypothetical protein
MCRNLHDIKSEIRERFRDEIRQLVEELDPRAGSISMRRAMYGMATMSNEIARPNPGVVLWMMRRPIL